MNAYEVKSGIGVITGKTMCSIPERFESEILQKERYVNSLTYSIFVRKWTRSSSGESTLAQEWTCQQDSVLAYGQREWLSVSLFDICMHIRLHHSFLL